MSKNERSKKEKKMQKSCEKFAFHFVLIIFKCDLPFRKESEQKQKMTEKREFEPNETIMGMCVLAAKREKKNSFRC